MKKYFKYIFIFLISICAFVCRVNAQNFTCDNSLTIQEVDDADPAYFDTTLSVCERMEFRYYNDIFTGDTYPDAKSYSEEQVKAYFASVDNKDFNLGYVARCSDVNTAVWGYLKVHDWKLAEWKDDYDDKCSDICKNKKTPGTCKSPYCKWESGPTQETVSASYMSSQKKDSIIGGIPAEVGTCKHVQDYCIKVVSGGHYECEDGWTLYAKYIIYGESMKNVCIKDSTVTIERQCTTPGYYFDPNIENPEGNIQGRCSTTSGIIPKYSISTKAQADKLIANVNKNLKNEAVQEGGSEGHEAYSVDYHLYCPHYKCIIDDKRVNACTPTFKVKSTGDKAYCINPSDSFSSGFTNEAKYRVDETFDVDKCSNSYNTVECGYANILIEGNYIKLKNPSVNTDKIDKAIDLALRLWGVHSGQGGFDNVGLSNRTGTNCGTGIWFVGKRGFGFNVYEQTYYYIMETAKNSYFEKANNLFNQGYLDPYGSASNFGISCPALHTGYDNEGQSVYVISDSSKYGVACSDNGSVSDAYKIAVGLLFNTILGNKEMRNHYYELNGGSPVNPIDADFVEIEENGKEKYIIKVKFEEEQYEEIFEKVKRTQIDCSQLDKDPVLKQYKDQIKPYCKTSTILYGKDGSKLTPEQYMQQNGCYSEVEFTYAICDELVKEKIPTKIITKYITTETVRPIVRYLPCNGGKNQIMYSMLEKKPSGTTIPGNDVTQYYIPGEKTFEVTGYLCTGNFCDELDIKETPPRATGGEDRKCKNDISGYTNGSFTKKIQDPSLKCIMNIQNDTIKEGYDYSDYFHVNTDLCRIYCSDEVEFRIADKVRESSGRNFKYNINIETGFASSSDIPPLAATVKEKRTCVSEIYYHDLTNSVKSLRRKYGLSESELPSLYAVSRNNVSNYINAGVPVTNIKDSNGNDRFYRPPFIVDLLRVLTDKANHENHRGENINQVIYDLYNCNLFSGSANDNFGSVQSGTDKAPATGNNIIRKPQDSKTGIVRNYINKEFSAANSYGLATYDDCKINPGNGETACIEHSTQYYDFAAEVDALNSGVEMGAVGLGKNSLNAVKYCSGNNCFNYVPRDPEHTYKYGNGDTTNKTTSYHTELRNINFRDVLIPTNDFAYFDITVEMGFYNKSLFEVEPNSGKVYYDSEAHNYIVTPAYTYPTDKYAFNKCSTLNNKTFDSEYRRCEITQRFERVATFHRENLFDGFKRAIKDNMNYTCYVDVTRSSTTEASSLFIYRNADPSNLFPNGIASNSNWATEEGIEAKAYIEKYSEDIKFDDSLVDYTITLTPQQVKNIKEYNRNVTYTYNEEPLDLDSCVRIPTEINKNGEVIKEEYYLECKSKFLNELRKDANNRYATIEMGPHSYEMKEKH